MATRALRLSGWGPETSASGISVVETKHSESGQGADHLAVLLTMDPIVFDARRHLANVLARVTDLPDYGTRWQPQVEAMWRDIPVLTDTTACLHYAQYNITFDGRPPLRDGNVREEHASCCPAQRPSQQYARV